MVRVNTGPTDGDSVSQDRDIPAILVRHPLPTVEPMTKTLRYPAIAALAATAVLLSGCTFRLADPGADEQKPDTDRETSISPQESEKPETEKPDDEETESPSISVDRQDAIDAATTTVACTDTASVDATGVVVRLEGDCGTVTIGADAAVVITDDAERIVLTGTGTIVYALEVGSVEISGDANLVRWTGSSPIVQDSGVANVVQKDS